MYCDTCKADIPYCVCPDIEERLRSLAEHPVIGAAAIQNLIARRLTVQKEDKGEH